MIKGGERERERERESGTMEQDLSGNRFPMDASTAELSSSRPFEPNGERRRHFLHCIGGMFFMTTFPVIKGVGVARPSTLCEEGMSTIQCAFVPISASTFCPSRNCASKLSPDVVCLATPIDSILLEAKYDAAPTDDPLSRP